MSKQLDRLCKICGTVATGLLSSATLYQVTHRDGTPELARYGAGSVLIAVGVLILTGDLQQALNTLEAAIFAGIGVAINRIILHNRYGEQNE